MDFTRHRPHPPARVCEHERVTDRLNPLDASFLYLEEPTTAMHVGSVMIFEAGSDSDAETALASAVTIFVAAPSADAT